MKYGADHEQLVKLAFMSKSHAQLDLERKVYDSIRFYKNN